VCRDDGRLPQRRELPDEPSRGPRFADRALLMAPRCELVVCSQVALSWTAPRVRSDREDLVTLYSVQFRDIVGATLRGKGVVEVGVDDGPTLSFRVMPGPPTRCRRTSTGRHNRSNHRRRETRPPRHPPSGATRNAYGLIEIERRHLERAILS
jgi:hypothetical protein